MIDLANFSHNNNEFSYTPQDEASYTLQDEVSYMPQDKVSYILQDEDLSEKKRQNTTNKATPLTSSTLTKNLRANASYTTFFFEDDKKNTQQLEGTHTQPYPYTKSGGSTGHLAYHFHEKHNITGNNYKKHLDSYQE
ncbi:13290_t:CDS:2, partial [Gigaspora margarita]